MDTGFMKLAWLLILIPAIANGQPLCGRDPAVAGCATGSGGGTGSTGPTGPTGATGGGASISGSDQQIVFFDSTTPTGATGATYNKTTDVTKGKLVDRGGAYINILAYGAIAGDSIDDTVAIQAAIDALPSGFVAGSGSSKKGGTIFAPAGQFEIGGAGGHCTSSSPANKACTADSDCTGGAAVGYCCAITSNSHALLFFGAGSFATEILMTGSNSLHGICINPGDNQSSVADMRIAKTASPGVGTGNGLIVQGQRARLRNLNVDRFGGHCILIDGEQTVARTNSDRIDRVSAGVCGGDGIFIYSHNDASIHTITNSEAEANGGYGLHLISSKNFISGFAVNTNASGGIFVDGVNNYIAMYCETASQPFCVHIEPTRDGNYIHDLSGSLDTAGQLDDDGLNNVVLTRGKYTNMAFKPRTTAPYDCDSSAAVDAVGGLYYDSDVHKLCRCDDFATGAPFPTSMWCPIDTPVSTDCSGGTSTDCGTEGSSSGNAISDVQLGNTDLPADDASIWMVGGQSRNELYGINKLSNVSIVSPANAGCAGSADPGQCCSGAGAGSCIAFNIASPPFYDSGIFSEAIIANASTNTVDLVVTTTSGSLPTEEFSSIAGWWVSTQWRDSEGVYPRATTVQAQYNGGGGIWNTIASTSAATTYWRQLATFTSISSPYTITAIRFHFSDWSGTGEARLLTVGLHHRSEDPFPAYLRRDGDSRFGMLAPLFWMASLGSSINHINGPSDQPLKIVSGSGQKLLLNGVQPCKDLVTNTTTVGNIGAGEDNLMSYTVPAATLGTDGNRVEFRSAGTIANSVNAKRIRIKYGSTTILDTGAAGVPISAAINWSVSGECIRTGATTQKCSATLGTSNATFQSFAGYSTAAETLSGTVIFKLTGEAVSDNDIVQETQHVTYCPGS